MAEPKLFLTKTLSALFVLALIVFSQPSAAPAAPGDIHTVAGDGSTSYSGDGSSATSAGLRGPRGVAADGSGAIYISDSLHNCVRRVDPDGTITTVSGTGRRGIDGDGGPAELAEMNQPFGISLGSSGEIYAADRRNRIVRVITPSGAIMAYAGDGRRGFSGDGGPAELARLRYPEGAYYAADGRVFIADTKNHRIRVVDASGIIETFAGRGRRGFSGDGGQAVSAMLRNPTCVAVGPAGGVYIADSGNNRIRKVDVSGVITTFAGTGAAGFSGDGGPAAQASLNRPSGIAFDGSGNLYIADTNNHRVRMVDASGTITTIAGSGLAGFSGDDGPATEAGLKNPYGVSADASGNVYIADTNNNRVRMVEALSPALPVSLVLSPHDGDTLGDGPVTVTGVAESPNGISFVEVSTDGGGSWNTASGTTAWNFHWGPKADGTYVIKSRATDAHNKTGKPSSGVDVTVEGTTPVSLTSITPDKAGVTAGERVTWTASATGGTGSYEYRFLRKGPGTGGLYTLTRDWSGSPDWSWDTLAADAGDSFVRVQARNSDLSGVTATLTSRAFTVEAPAPPAPANSVPAGVSVSAAAGTVGVSQQVSAVWSDADGAADISLCYLEVGGGGSMTRLKYDHAQDLLYLLTDSQSDWLGGFAPGSNNTISNAVVSVECSGTTVGESGNRLTVSFKLTPSQALAGTQPLSLFVYDAASAHPAAYEQLGSWTVSAPAPEPEPTPVSVDSLDYSTPDPVTPETAVTWSASASGGTGSYHYRFLKKGPGVGSSFVVVKDWSSAASWTWNTTSSDVGDSYVMVEARNSDLSGSVATKTSSAYTVEEAPAPPPPPPANMVDVRNYGATGNGVTDDTSAVIAAINSANSGQTVYFPAPSSYYRVSSTISVNKPLTLLGEYSQIRMVSGDTRLLDINASDVTVQGLRLVGPQFASESRYSQAISVSGSSASSPIRNLRIIDNKIEKWGFYGVYMLHVTDFEVSFNEVRDIYYGAIMGYSVIRGGITDNTIDGVVATGNAYGIALTRVESDSLTSSPRPSDIVVSRNTVSNVPDWEGLDTHGGQRMIFSENVVSGTKHGIVVGKSDGSGDAPKFAPQDIQIIDNVIDNGTAQSTGFGIAITGAKGPSAGQPVQNATGIVIRGNYIRAYGNIANYSSGAAYFKGTDGLEFSDNTVVNAGANGVILYSDNYDVSITGNEIIDPWTNNLSYASGVFLSSGYNSCYVGNNNFRKAGKSASRVLTNAMWVVSDPSHSLTVGGNYSEASTYVKDPGGRANYQ